MCVFFFFFGYPITNPTKHLVMMDSGEIWGERALLMFSTLWRGILMTFLTASTDRNGKMSDGPRQSYAKRRKIGVGIDINTRPPGSSFGLQTQTRAK